jgi:hypothetical protein
MGVMVHKHPESGRGAPMQVQELNGFDYSAPAEFVCDRRPET